MPLKWFIFKTTEKTEWTYEVRATSWLDAEMQIEESDLDDFKVYDYPNFLGETMPKRDHIEKHTSCKFAGMRFTHPDQSYNTHNCRLHHLKEGDYRMKDDEGICFDCDARLHDPETQWLISPINKREAVE